VNTSHKIEFHKFDCAGDPVPWLNRCERYFSLRGTPADRRVQVASFYLLDDAQVWYHRVELNSGQLSWNRFIQLINTRRFRPPLTESLIGELAYFTGKGPLRSTTPSSWSFLVGTRPSPKITKSNCSQRGSATSFVRSRSRCPWTRQSCTLGPMPRATRRTPFCHHRRDVTLCTLIFASRWRRPHPDRARDKLRRSPPSTAHRSPSSG
jgi:hypothetical protein